MLIFLSMIITLTVCVYYFKISPVINKKFFGKKTNFNMIMSKSDFDEKSYKSDLLSFRHEFGETIFELQREINFLRDEINNLKNEISKEHS